MQNKISSFLDFFLKIKEALVILAAVFLWLLGIWFTNRLGPIVSDMEDISTKVKANSSEIVRVEENCNNSSIKTNKRINEVESDIDADMDLIHSRLNKIYEILISEI